MQKNLFSLPDVREGSNITYSSEAGLDVSPKLKQDLELSKLAVSDVMVFPSFVQAYTYFEGLLSKEGNWDNQFIRNPQNSRALVSPSAETNVLPEYIFLLSDSNSEQLKDLFNYNPSQPAYGTIDDSFLNDNRLKTLGRIPSAGLYRLLPLEEFAGMADAQELWEYRNPNEELKFRGSRATVYYQRDVSYRTLENTKWQRFWGPAKSKGIQPDTYLKMTEDDFLAVRKQNTKDLQHILLSMASRYFDNTGLKLRFCPGAYYELHGYLRLPVGVQVEGNGAIVNFTSDTGGAGLLVEWDHDFGDLYQYWQGNKNFGSFILPTIIENLELVANANHASNVYGVLVKDVPNVHIRNCTIESNGEDGICFLMKSVTPESVAPALNLQNDEGRLDPNKVFASYGMCQVVGNRVSVRNDGARRANGISFNVDLRPIIGTKSDGSAQGMDLTYAGTLEGAVTDVKDVRKYQNSGQDVQLAERTYMRHTRCLVEGNTIEGSRYGICGFYMEDSVIRNNTTKDNVRGIVLQNRSMRNVIQGNTILDCESAGILVNYMSQDNIVQGNTVLTTKGRGQGLIHVSLNCTNTKIVGNTLTNTYPDNTEASNYSMWGIYLGVDCSGSRIVNNYVDGHFKKAVLAVEGGWVAQDTHTESYGSTMGSEYADRKFWTKGNLKDVHISNNHLHQKSSAHTVVYIASEQAYETENSIAADKGGIEGLLFSSNTVSSDGQGMLIRLLEKATIQSDGVKPQIKAVSYGGNTYASKADDVNSKVALGEDRMFAVKAEDLINGYQKPAAPAPAPQMPAPAFLTMTPEGEIQVPSTNGLLINTQTAGELRTLTGGVAGQIIYLRYMVGLTVKATSSIRTMRGENLPLSGGLDSNKMSTFLCLATNVWTEVSRNF